MITNNNNVVFCNNCNKYGHVFFNCRHPTTSVGIIVCRPGERGGYEYLMICRKHSLGYMDFMRGKYPLYNKLYLSNIISEMTREEKDNLLTKEFDYLWINLWGGEHVGIQYRGEEKISREKFESLRFGVAAGSCKFNMTSLMKEEEKHVQQQVWEEPEWGFPKGRHNNKETDMQCALREFEEETGYSRNDIKILQNVLPLDEIFMGSNYKCYKHKYYVAMIEPTVVPMLPFQSTEVSKMEWYSYEVALQKIRNYNLDKKKVLTSINELLTNYSIVC